MLTTSASGTSSSVAIFLRFSGERSPSSIACSWPLSLRRLKKSFFCAAVVPIFTSDHECRMYSWIAARIQDRKSTRLNSSHANISYAVFCLKKKKDKFELQVETEVKHYMLFALDDVHL